MREIKLALVALAALALAAQTALAVGGSDEDPSNQINKATYGCQQAILKGASQFRKVIEKDFTKCLLAAMKCDQAATDAGADACREKLLMLGTGFCAIGRIDSGALLFGGGSAANAVSSQATKAEKALAKWVAGIQKKCFDTPGVDLSVAGTGLGFSGSPASASELADQLNKNNIDTGVACSAFEDVALKLMPTAVSALLQLFIQDGSDLSTRLAKTYAYLVNENISSYCSWVN
jgi:hypothetical protein